MSNTFSFQNYLWDNENGELSLNYLCSDYNFTEKIIFPNAPFVLSKDKEDVLDELFFLLHIAAGVSYYKAFKNPAIQIKSGILSAKQADFFNKFYYYGLAQYASENKLKLHFKFPFQNKENKTFDISLSDDAFVPVGGGKDSCLTIQRLTEKGMNPTLFSVNTARPIADCKRVAGFSEITIKRIISPELIANNDKFLNGHVPISGIIAFISAIACVLYDKRYVVMSCEGSADENNFDDVNHQWSKSSAFEVLYADLMKDIIPQYRYFSLLRPMTEMQIASEFAKKCQNYFDVFTSCNHAFHLNHEKRLDRWCGVCDKCRFVFLILAPFMQKELLIKIIGTNPLDDEKQEQGYLQLLGLGENKPFECVGTYDECRLAFLMLAEKNEWKNDCLIKKLSLLLNKISKKQLDEKVWAKGNSNLIPQEFRNV
ncbi:MAG: hypothetical protein E7013_00315 [Alphaproteobacteria bacterium]|nr:hypothetical protein [Alphaproteobacteria bacterium]